MAKPEEAACLRAFMPHPVYSHFYIISYHGGLAQVRIIKKRQKNGLLNKILADFKALGYEISCQPYHAEHYGVPQTRERVFIVGTKAGKPAFTPPPITAAEPITAQQAIGDLEGHPKDREFSHIWSLANASGEQGNRRLIADRPGYTIRAECHGNIQFRYSLPRRISMREAARIQSFPDTFRFPGKLRETEMQIGNAVPPVLAWHVAKAVEPLIERGSV
ncbi:MAG: DNA cytosine methyltransferase [Clostridiales Family XIII bacterium]|jgi:DNA (cytosine-5)-methyltransferase 1|nr:DNA cytosine methyltransferase [Clostridiales Family XIII bacterium]